MTQARNCGHCRECCIVLEVEGLAKPSDTPCRHLCGGGCSIYPTRPKSCAAFTCAWREGMLAHSDRPSNTHHVIWVTAMTTRTGERMEILQCNIRSGVKRHKKTVRWLGDVSFKMPVLFVQDGTCSMLSYGKFVGSWHQDDFVNLDFDGPRVIDVQVRPRSEVLATPEAEAEWRQTVAANTEVIEDDPEYRRTQIKYTQQKA